MKRKITFVALACLVLISCAKKENSGEPQQSADAKVAVQPTGGPHAFVRLKDGTKVPGSIVASSQVDIVLAGDDGIERKIPLAQVVSVEYGDAQSTLTARQASRERARQKRLENEALAPPQPRAPQQIPSPAYAPPPPSPVTTKTYELPVGS